MSVCDACVCAMFDALCRRLSVQVQFQFQFPTDGPLQPRPVRGSSPLLPLFSFLSRFCFPFDLHSIRNRVAGFLFGFAYASSPSLVLRSILCVGH